MNLDGHLLYEILAARANTAGRLAVGNAALDAAALGRCQVG